MNKFNEQYSVRNLIADSNEANLSPTTYAVAHGKQHLLASPLIWDSIDEDDVNLEFTKTSICLPEIRDDILSQFSREICNKVQFPLDTAYSFGLGAVASAMTKAFTYDYYGDTSPVNLYCVQAQPPSSGKSAIVKFLADPVSMSFNDINHDAKKAQRSIKVEIRKAESDLKKVKSDHEEIALMEKLDELLEELDKYPIYNMGMDDPTPESLAKFALDQGGLFSVISAEADAVNTILGASYKSKDSKTNFSPFLKGWDGEMYNPTRIGRETKSGKLRGSVCILAQDESIKTILEAGLSGRGISERILMVREENMLGKRKHTASRDGIDAKLRYRYKTMIDSLVKAEDTTLVFDYSANEIISDVKNSLENTLGDGAENSHSMMRGFVGKADKHICKIASVLHGIKEWDESGSQSITVSPETMMEAVRLFYEFMKSYISASDSQGYIGSMTQISQVNAALSNSCKKGILRLTYKQLRDSIKNLRSMEGVSMLTEQIKNNWLPAMRDQGVCVFDEKYIYINPKINE